jgi:endonuclease-3
MAARKRSKAASDRRVADTGEAGGECQKPRLRKDSEVAELMERLAEAIPNPRCELDHSDAWTLLIATILSAQSTDKIINTVTPELFRRWPTPAALAAAPREEVEQAVHRTGFFRNKAKAIQECSRAIVERHGGEVPADMGELVKLPGVARKTANVVLGIAFGIPSGIAVDTHVVRISGLLGLSHATKPEQIERDLCDRLPEQLWIEGGHRLLLHGRYLCTARKPDCVRCPINELCPSRQADPEGSWQQRAGHEQALVAASGS